MIPAALAERLATILVENVARLDPHVEDACSAGRTPIFCGCYDWHSAVHSHWALMRLRSLVADVTRVLDERITPEAAGREAAFLGKRPAFEVPYGIAWLLALCREARETRWHAPLAGLEQVARDRMVAWVEKLPAPIRSGEHAQSAFAIGLALDWARGTADEAIFTAAAERHHGADRAAPPGWEPSAYDFLSPSLGAASLIARVRAPDDFARWLDAFGAIDPVPVRAADRTDDKLVHWDGLNLSRAWMLARIARALPADRRAPYEAMARAHLDAGLAALDDLTYAGAHWLPSFAVYALTGP